MLLEFQIIFNKKLGKNCKRDIIKNKWKSIRHAYADNCRKTVQSPRDKKNQQMNQPIQMEGESKNIKCIGV